MLCLTRRSRINQGNSGVARGKWDGGVNGDNDNMDFFIASPHEA